MRFLRRNPAANQPAKTTSNRLAGSGTRAPVPLPLPPDVTSLSQLPAIVLYGEDLDPGTTNDNLASWADTRRMPFAIASLEWARYLDLPMSVIQFGSLSDGGTTNSLWSSFNLDNFVEGMGKAHCVQSSRHLRAAAKMPAARIPACASRRQWQVRSMEGFPPIPPSR